MGFSESVSVYFGLKIVLKDLVNQIDETNYDKIKEMLQDCNCFINDENNQFNSMFENIRSELWIENNPKRKTKKDKVILDYITYKNKFNEQISKRGTMIPLRNGKEEEKFDYGYLSDQIFLYPVTHLLHTERYGYDRSGINGTYCNLDFDIESIKKSILDKYNWLKDIEVVMIIKQDSG